MMQVHGGNYGQYPDILDFSANLNPLGMPERVRQAVTDSAETWEQYPDPNCTALTEALARRYDCEPGQIVCGNGAADLIYRIAGALRPRTALLCEPCFSEYRKALEETSCAVETYFLREQDGFRLTGDILAHLHGGLGMLFLCSPNNPTGRRIEPELLQQVAKKCAENGTFLVCDGCFLGFTENAGEYSLRRCLYGNGIILSAFTKLWAMPGLRLGYAVCGDAEIAGRIRERGQFWSVSAPAQAAGLAALGETAYLARTIKYVCQEREFLAEGLRAAGIRVYDGEANFLLIQAFPGFAEEMLRRGILVRSCGNFIGLDETFFRLAVRTRKENEILLRAVREAETWQRG